MKTIKIHHGKGIGKGKGKGLRQSRHRRGPRSSKFRRSKRPKYRTGKRVRFAMGGGKEDTKLIIFFKSKGCMHCDNMNEALSKLIEVPDQNVEYQTLESSADDYDKKKKNIENKYGITIKVEGFPHIVKIVPGKVSEYNGNRSTSDMLKWVRT
jgi:glutaredoxin